MKQPTSKLNIQSGTLDRVMQPEHFNQVIDAILSGKYSWACVLILKFAGYNPLHYIPYRTYNRIMKDNKGRKKVKQKTKTPSDIPTVAVQDLGYTKTIGVEQQKIQGGMQIVTCWDVWI